MVRLSQTPVQSCPACGTPIPATMPEGLCPACVAREILSAPGEASVAGQPAAEPLGGLRFFGDYELVEEIGRGGMGVVFKARQLGVNREVALKVLSGGAAAGREFVHRFHTEAATAASLSHSHIVPVYEFGEHEGTHFLAMRFMEGGTLQTSRGRWSPAEAARLVMTIAEAVQSAHQHGILHRDLKPGNILLDRNGDPYVSDFGLARVMGGDSDLTLSHAVLGTVAYLAPEVAARGGSAATIASDIYGLGAILYELLTGRAPFEGATLAEVLRKVQEQEPARPGVAARSSRAACAARIPPDLETICLKALEKNPAKRYATAQELGDDLGRFLRREPIVARPLGPVARLWRWCCRRPALAGTLLLLHMVFVFGLAGILWQWRRAELNAEKELRARQYAQAQSYTADMNLVHQAWEKGSLNRAQALLRAHIPKPGEPDLRGLEWRFLWGLCRDQSRVTLTNFPAPVRSVAFTPGGGLLLAGSDKVIKVLDPVDFHLIGELRDGNATISMLAVCATCSNLLATAGWKEPNIRLWDLSARSLIAKIPSADSQVNALAVSSDGRLLAWTSASAEIETWDIARRTILWRPHLEHPSLTLAFSPDGQQLVSGGSPHGGNAVFWDARTGEQVPGLPAAHGGWLTAVAFSPDGRTLATASLDGSIICWDFQTRRRLQTFTGNGRALAFSPDGRHFAAGGGDNIIRVWDLAEPGTAPILLRGHRAGVTSVAFAPDGQSLISGSDDGTLKVWSLDSPATRNILMKTAHWVTTVAISPDGKLLAAADYHENRAALFELPSRRWITNFGGHSAAIQGVAFSPDRKWLATGSEDQTVRLWNLNTLQLESVFTNDFQSTLPAFSPDSRILAVAGWVPTASKATNTLAFWDLHNGTKLERLPSAASGAAGVAFSHAGRFVATARWDGSIKIWSWPGERLVAAFHASGCDGWSLAFSPDDTLLACSSEFSPAVYDLRKRELSHLEGYGCATLAFSRDSKSLICGGGDGLLFWNLATRAVALDVNCHSGGASGLAISPDETLLATSGVDGTVRLWPAPSLVEIDRFQTGH